MSGATMQGVTLYSKTRKHQNDVFELALTYDGIEIRRPGESPRHLSWDRVSEWEIEQRRGGVLLTLRGGGAVTPLIIPRWGVDELDVVLREVTSHAPSEPAEDLFHMPPASEPPRPPRRPTAPSSASAAAAVPEEPPPAPMPQTPISPPTVAAPTPPPPEPTPPSSVTDSAPSAPVASAPTITRHDVTADPAIPPLQWPNDSPLDEIPSLSWPSSMTARPEPDRSEEFVLPDEPLANRSAPSAPTAVRTEVAPEPAPEPPAPAPAQNHRDVVVADGPVVDVLALVDDVLAAPEVEALPDEREARPKEMTQNGGAVLPSPPPPTVAAAPPPAPVAPVVEPAPRAAELPPIVIPPQEGASGRAADPLGPPTAAVPAPPRRKDRRLQREAEPRRDPRPPARPTAPAPTRPATQASPVTATAAAGRATATATATRPAVSAKPAKPATTRPTKAPKTRPAKAPRTATARRLTWRAVTTFVLLTALALAVALVLAQSAGLVHLPFFGSPT